jgi:hypothetical protein
VIFGVPERVSNAIGGDDDREGMTDRMTVGLPLGPVGEVVTRILLVSYLRQLLGQRAAHVKRVAEANADRA